MEDRLLRRREVEALTGLARAALMRHVAKGTFPPPLKINSRCNRWKESAVRAWIASLPEKGATPAAEA
ncbi:helix-turn-helix transcriptional regulator [Pararhodospirillum oryzae]|uniref:Uncharacterized protein n=1 Tax=Pararhodospirillum oryzae TaxID=478448 RepID=A0A512HAY4_9PROT|nr:AlpA family phage regulatory protein [Pararhodospirillum oryzae]GEO82595.1 hypothetical protein ROR02_27260 [Pararhodospirillum oryzae]